MFRFCVLIWLIFCSIPASARGEPVIVILGDSLSAGYGINLEQGWVAQLQQRLTAEDHPHRVINTSISGDTTRGALKRLDSILERHRPDVVIIELGGNDGLRGLSLEEMRENFSAIIEKSREGHAKVLLIRMRIPTNYGPVYVRQFEKLFDDLIREYAIHDAPFILRGIAERPELMQADGIHPRAAAQTLMLDNIWSSLVPLL